MPALTPTFLFDLESNMRVISANLYDKLNARVWWRNVAKELPSQSKKERITWLLDTARIKRTISGGGQVTFEDILSQTTEFENDNASGGLELKKEQLEDLDGNGVKLAAHWARQMGAYAAYWPQKEIARAIKANPNTYDGLPFFSDISAPHLVNPFKSGAGSFANDFTGAVSGSYPGALPISGVTVDVAVENIAKAIAYVEGIKMPNGEDPRNLKVAGIMGPPALTARLQQVTKAKFIAQDSDNAGGSADVEAVISNFGLGMPIIAPELGGSMPNGSDTTWYLLMQDITSDELGAFVYVNREPFSMIMHGEMTDAELARTRKLQWTTEGRNVVGAGHPYLMFRCKAT